jgi:hypothetical protein
MKITIRPDIPGLDQELKNLRLATGESPYSLVSPETLNIDAWYRIERGEAKSTNIETLIQMATAMGYRVDFTIDDTKIDLINGKFTAIFTKEVAQ